jgi:hypothetical protein
MLEYVPGNDTAVDSILVKVTANTFDAYRQLIIVEIMHKGSGYFKIHSEFSITFNA